MISQVLNPDMNHQWNNANETAVSRMVINIQDSGITGPVEMDIVYD